MPLVGLTRNIVVAETDDKAKELARGTFLRWRESFLHLWAVFGDRAHVERMMPDNWDAWEATGSGCAGSPDTVRDFVSREIEVSGVNYFAAFLMFGSPRCGRRRGLGGALRRGGDRTDRRTGDGSRVGRHARVGFGSAASETSSD